MKEQGTCARPGCTRKTKQGYDTCTLACRILLSELNRAQRVDTLINTEQSALAHRCIANACSEWTLYMRVARHVAMDYERSNTFDPEAWQAALWDDQGPGR